MEEDKCKCSSGGTSGTERELVAKAKGRRWCEESWIYKIAGYYSLRRSCKNWCDRDRSGMGVGCGLVDFADWTDGG